MTEQERVWQRFTALPADAQRQVAELISFLHAHQVADAPAEPQRAEAEQPAFFGIWRGREDLTDSSVWVREIRKREWSTRQSPKSWR